MIGELSEALERLVAIDAERYPLTIYTAEEAREKALVSLGMMENSDG